MILLIVFCADGFFAPAKDKRVDTRRVKEKARRRTCSTLSTFFKRNAVGITPQNAPSLALPTPPKADQPLAESGRE